MLGQMLWFCVIQTEEHFPWEIESTVRDVNSQLANPPLGIHTHNDGELGVAKHALCSKRQSVLIGSGYYKWIWRECGNADLCSIIPNLKLKLGYRA